VGTDAEVLAHLVQKITEKSKTSVAVKIKDL
jgi:glucosamine 6-phosphate synthetase-like amidotransferase/phosphosugar isomerase protein